MSNITRYQLIDIAESLGRAQNYVMEKFGDLTKSSGAWLELESLLARLRGSTLFHDEDVAEQFLHFGATDNVGLGIQGANIISPITNPPPFQIYKYDPWGHVANFWIPTFSPPTPEGWNITDYHVWSSWQPSREINPAAWLGVSTEPDIQNRLVYNYPTRYSILTNSYTRIPMFKSARFISVYNEFGSYINSDSTIAFDIPMDVFDGLDIYWEDINGIVKCDLNIYCNPNLIQLSSGSQWQALAEPIADGSELTQITGFQIKRNGNNLVFEINVPFDNVWAYQTWCHFIFYWGSTDDIVALSPGVNGFTPVSDSPLIFNNIDILIWERKNFFDNSINDNITSEFLGVNDPNAYLIAQDRTHFTENDGDYVNHTIPEKYLMHSDWESDVYSDNSFILPDSSSLAINTFAGYASFEIGDKSVIPVIVCVKTPDISVTDTPCISQIIVGPRITPEFFPNKWANCLYFPPIPQDYVLIARFILGRTNGHLYGLPQVNINFDLLSSDYNVIINELSVIWMEQSVYTFAAPQIQQTELFQYLLPALGKLVKIFRGLDLTSPFINAAFKTLVYGAQTHSYLVSTLNDVTSDNSNASLVFRSLLKTPTNPIMLDPNQTAAIQFTDSAREVISEVAGQPPSIELLRFNANNLFLTGQELNMDTELEIYQDYLPVGSSQLTPGLANDYTLRLELGDSSENVLYKDWFIMASNFLITQQQYQDKQNSGEGVLGYFTNSMLNDINTWRRYGYAGYVPDLSTGQSRTMKMRPNSPQDSTQLTEDQYRAQLAAKHYTQAQIDQIVSDYNGTFYTVDLNQYPNTFTEVRNASLSITTYTEASVAYWDPIADSFIIATQGLPVGDLESSQVNVITGINNTNTISSDLDFIEDLRAFRVINDDAQSYRINQIDLRIRSNSSLTNSTGGIFVSLWSDSNGPSIKLIDCGTVNYISLEIYYWDFILPFTYIISKNQIYWIVLEKTVAPVGGIIQIEVASS